MLPAATRPYLVSPTLLPGMQLLARVRFGMNQPVSDEPGYVAVALPVLSGPADEYWLSHTPVRRGWQDGLGYAENGSVLFGHLHLPEEELQRIGLERAVFHAYAHINHLLHGRGYPHWLRMWNFLAQITGGRGEAERYRLFNAGRSKALELKHEFERQLPAATAIGTPEGGLVIYFVGAAQTAGVQVENPRQISAFQYPRQYGIRSPSFSRATRVEWPDASDLLVSGTASVVGHESRHEGDVLAQLQETLINVEHLQAEAARQRGAANKAYQPQSLRLYLRDPSALPLLLPPLQARFGGVPLTCLLGEICRKDLALELEGVFSA